MTSDELKNNCYDRILAYLRQHLNNDEFLPVSKEGISTLTKTQKWMVDRTLMILTKKGYLAQKRIQAGNTYKKLDGFDAVVPFSLNVWVTAYNEEVNARSIDKKGQLEAFGKPDKRTKPALTFGFMGQTGYLWYETPELAARNAQEIALESGQTRIDIVQRVGEVIIQPTVKFF